MQKLTPLQNYQSRFFSTAAVEVIQLGQLPGGRQTKTLSSLKEKEIKKLDLSRFVEIIESSEFQLF